MTTTAKYDPSTADAIFARDQRRHERKIARIRAQHEREQAHRARTQQLINAVATMASRIALTERQYGRAYCSPSGQWAGKDTDHYERTANRQRAAHWRLLWALQEHANKAVKGK